ncbi:uncharacterized protein ACA1_256490 [Acanthamoeba castellanii str. Neff]|uniref:Uncharacterized protein n=1 Tax=Acanthamoeba castellanii (strain ATCC 30010 / Neff) TaxID=1257118 RepID=L8GEI4_ACACF|nr:uncharacterized protein ACA1_256490 [Acanthamoeba castellanii str. Neff]ELR11510.1 hypothetical protein ACA1_256490 [Acanthamoeba castellanii str. Neff]
MKRRRAGDVAEGVEGEAAQGGAGFDTGARHYRDTKQVKNDLKAIQDAPTLTALMALGIDRDDAQERSWKVKAGQCAACLAGGGEDDASVLECSYCQRDICLACLQRCELCQQLFCPTCTTTNHELRQDRVLCLSCNTEDLKQMHDHQQQQQQQPQHAAHPDDQPQPMDEVPAQ